MPICNLYGNAALDTMFSGSPRWLALMNGDPTSAGLLTQEMAGDGYVRKPVVFTVANSMDVENEGAVWWADLPTTPIRYIAVVTALTGGSVVAYAATGSDIVVAEGYKFIIEDGKLGFSITG
jgi:hypothetical protein